MKKSRNRADGDSAVDASPHHERPGDGTWILFFNCTGTQSSRFVTGMKRTQLSLFFTGPLRVEIERVRGMVDPIQRALIPAHVTVCREDELTSLSALTLAGKLVAQSSVSLTFGDAIRFGGHGIMLQCTKGADGFRQLRRRLLGEAAHEATSHLTLAHPRNAMAMGNSLSSVDLALPIAATFDRLMLVEQEAPGTIWRVVGEFPFGSM